MALTKISQVKGACVVIPGDDVDTDRIIPARFMKCVTFDGLGEYLFYDVRFDEQGNRKEHPLNDSRSAGATILIAGRNFGCGSSREHAPQAIYRYGFRAVLAESFAEIFFGNSTTLGIPCVSASRDDLAVIRTLVEKNPEALMTIDLATNTIRIEGSVFRATIRESASNALLNGRWDAIAELLEDPELVSRRAAQLPYMASRA